MTAKEEAFIALQDKRETERIYFDYTIQFSDTKNGEKYVLYEYINYNTGSERHRTKLWNTLDELNLLEEEIFTDLLKILYGK